MSDLLDPEALNDEGNYMATRRHGLTMRRCSERRHWAPVAIAAVVAVPQLESLVRQAKLDASGRVRVPAE